MLTGHMPCPCCSEELDYTCELEVGPVISRTYDTVTIAVEPVNVATDHHCKTPAGFPIAC
jgi:hypothetical protein